MTATFPCRCFLILLLLSVLRAQESVPLAHQSWSTEEGLPQASVHGIVQAQDGFFWLATEGGVVRYDGVSFRDYSHESDPTIFSSNDVTSVLEDQAGNLWFGTADGLLQQKNGRWKRFSVAEGLPSEFISGLSLTPGGQVLAETESGNAEFRNTRFLVSDTVTPSNAVVVQGGMMWRWNKRSVQVQTSSWHTGKELPGVRVQTLMVDRRGVGWVGTNHGLVTVVSGQSAATSVKELGANSILSLLEDREGDVWVGTETSGLHALRPRKFRSQPGLEDDEISCGATASDGAVWIGTREDGLRRVSALGAVQRPIANEALTSPIILAMAAGLKGDLWVGTPDGLNHVEANGKVRRITSADGLPDDLVRSLLVAPDGSVWAGTRRGLAHLAHGRVEVISKAQGLGSDLMGALFARDGEVWAGTLGGLSVIGPRGIRNYGPVEGLTSSLVTSFSSDAAGRLWIATRDAGLFLFDRGRFLLVRAPNLPAKIFGVLSDAQGNLWLRTERGVVRAAAEELKRCATGESCLIAAGSYGAEDGMPSAELVENGEPAAWRSAAGALWFATRKGVAIANPAQFPANLVPPPVVIEGFFADSEEEPVDSGTVEIQSGHARYTFDFAGLSFVVPSKVLYQSRLEGFDSDWSAFSARRNASYTNLPPGTYTFRVRAANNDGVWNEAGASLKFLVLPPFYRRWWFVLLVLLGGAGLVVLFYRLRVRRLQRGFDSVLGERNRIAREIHDTLAQDFVGVSLQLDLVGQLLTLQKLPEASEQLKATRSYVKAGLEEARQSIWNLRADAAKGSLPTRLTELVRRHQADAPAVKARIGGAYRALPATVEDEVLRIVGEAVSNAERHAAPTFIHVEVDYAQDRLFVRVVDDGCGFVVEEGFDKAGHFGLHGMQERAASLAAKLNVHSEPGAGTKLELRVPIAPMKGAGQG